MCVFVRVCVLVCVCEEREKAVASKFNHEVVWPEFYDLIFAIYNPYNY